MEEYLFIHIDVARKREGIVVRENVEELILEQVKKGWTFVQLIDFTKHVNGHYKLVFKK